MKNQHLTRREMLGATAATAGAFMLPTPTKAEAANNLLETTGDHSFTYCLNTSTIMGHNLKLVDQIELAAKTGYDGIEIWVNMLEQYVEEGGKLKDLRSRIKDLNIKVEDAIGFAKWIVDDNDTRIRALEQAKREMDMLAQIGCHRIAAPPAGATNYPGLDLDKAAERFRALVELGVKMEVLPQLEVWGFSQNLFQLSQVLYLAAACGHPATRLLLDAYHLHKGGSDFDGLKLIREDKMEIFHINDYPADPPRKEIADKDRVYPGDGVAPLNQILQDLYKNKGVTVLSLELFNRAYWAQPVEEVAKTGLAKMKAAVQSAFSNK